MDLKKYKNTFVLLVTGGFTVLIYWIITKGKTTGEEERTCDFQKRKWFME
jgi:hypothetical protein